MAGNSGGNGSGTGSNYGQTLICSFCGKSEAQVERMIAGPKVNICNECVKFCDAILAEEELKAYEEGELGSLALQEAPPTPAQMKEALDQYVIGQDEAKRAICVAVYNHYKRLFAQDTKRLQKAKEELEQRQKAMPAQLELSGNRTENLLAQAEEGEEVELTKSNILLLGPTGSGKTLLAQTLARILDVPFAMTDATALTEAGYVGEDVENILVRLVQNADYDIERAQRGIIYIDEIDKISRRSDNPSITRDVSGEGVQQALLKILESTVANIPPQGGRKHPHQEYLQIDTSHILFICGGAFDGIERIIKNRLGKGSIGFGASLKNKELDSSQALLKSLEPEDLLKFGLIPEFIGRIPFTVTLNPLDEEALVSILTKPRNALLKQYKKLLEFDGVELEFEDEAIVAIAKKALERKTGARGLRAILEELMMDVMFEVPSREDIERCVVTAEMVNGNKSVDFILKT